MRWRAPGLIFAAAAALLLAACAHPGGTLRSEGARDWVTESDESLARKRARLRLELAAAYYQQGQDAVALDEVKQALASDPQYAPAWNLRGVVYLRLGQMTLAEESLQRALEIAPGDADAAHNYGWLLCQHPNAQSRYAQAEALFQRALAQPGYAYPARSWIALGICQQQAGHLSKAEASLSQALVLEPDNGRIRLMRARVLHDLGRWREAGEQMARLHQESQASAESLWLAVKVARKTDNPQLAGQLAQRLRHEFGRSREAQALDKGLFDE